MRSQQGIRPTQFALGLISPLKSVLQDIDTMLAATEFIPETAETTFTIAATDYAQTTFLAPLMSNVNRLAPNIRFSIVSTDIRRMPEQLDRQEIDFAVTVPEMAPSDAHVAKLFEDRYVCALSPEHPMANQKLSLDRFCALDHVLVTPSNDGFYGPTDEALARLGRKRRVAVAIPNFLALPNILRDSEFIAVAPERMLRRFEKDLCIFPAPLRLSRFRVISVWHELSDRSPAHVWLRDRMKDAYAAMA